MTSGTSPQMALLLLGFLGLLDPHLGHPLQVLEQLVQLVLDGGQHLHGAQAGLLLAADTVLVHVQHLAVQALQQLVLRGGRPPSSVATRAWAGPLPQPARPLTAASLTSQGPAQQAVGLGK